SVLYLFLMHRLPPCSPFFPYTTLFRSGVFLLFLAYGYKHGGQHQARLQTILKRNFIIATLLFGVGLSYMFIFLFFKINFSLNLQDRKSTRLNSSHVKISYAVFCLKKKI